MATNNKISEMQVGILTVFALVILIGGLLWLKNIDLSKGSLLYQVDFNYVEGMAVGDRVQVRGIRMGEVVGMTMLQESVRVEIQVEDTVDLREDAVVTLGEKGIVGEIVLEIDPGLGTPVAAGHIFMGRTAGTIAAMTDAAGAALDELRVLTSKITELVDEVKDDGMVIESLTQANETLQKVDAMIVDNHAEVERILDNLGATSLALRKVLESGKIDRAFEGAETAMVQADSLMVQLGASASRLDTLLIKISDGDGTMAKLMNDPMLYDRADSTIASIKRLVDALRRNPKRQFKLNVIDF